MANTRLLFVDNLRTLAIVLVILVHLAITYGGEGGWFYRERPADTVTSVVLTIHNATAQSFFMGLLFLLSAYLTVGSYDRKGPGRFLKDRFLRLGVPLIVYEFIIHPLQAWPLIKAGALDVEGSYAELLARYYTSFHIGSGPLWFVETLLIFALLYAAVRRVRPQRPHASAEPSSPPGPAAICLFALALGLLTFFARLWWPVGWGFGPLNLQLCFFAQYIAMLIVGVIAYRNDWLARLPKSTGRLCLGLASFLVVVIFPAMFLLGGATSGDVSKFLSGWHWQAFAYAVWEQLTGVALVVGLIVLFRERCNHQGRLLKEAAASSYAAYLIHASVLILFTLAVRSIAIYPLLKFAFVALMVVPLCFALGAVIRRLPLARQIL